MYNMYINNSLRNALHLITWGYWSIYSGADIAAEISRINLYGNFVIEARELRTVRVYTDEFLKPWHVFSTAEPKLLLEGLLGKFFPDKPLNQRETKVAAAMNSRHVLSNILNRSLIKGLSRVTLAAILSQNLEERGDQEALLLEVWEDSWTVKVHNLILQIVLGIFVWQERMGLCLKKWGEVERSYRGHEDLMRHVMVVCLHPVN